MAVPITNLVQALPFIKRAVWLPLLNLVGEKNEFRIIITSSDYVEIRVLWGLFSFERGEKREFVVQGTEAYVTSIISSLSSRGLDVSGYIER